jgi:hypothetical protein
MYDIKAENLKIRLLLKMPSKLLLPNLSRRMLNKFPSINVSSG